MKQFILGFFSAAVLFAIGYFVFLAPAPVKPEQALQFLSSTLQNNETGQPEKTAGAVFCDTQKNSCVSYEKAKNPGNLLVTVTAGGKPAGKVEVDLGTVPGDEKYYMKETDDKGVALFENVPAGFYAIYFNFNNFPQGYDASQTLSARITKGQTTEKTIELIKNKN